MMHNNARASVVATTAVLAAILCSCRSPDAKGGAGESANGQRLVDQYAVVRLEADLSDLTESERAMLPLLLEASDLMDGIFWQQASGHTRDFVLSHIDDPLLRRYAEINYGPWDRLDGNASFIEGHGPKPLGAGFYPRDLSADEFEKYVADHPDQADSLRSLYTIVQREGNTLKAVPYHQHFSAPTQRAAELLRQASELADDPGLTRYLSLRADALLSDDYRPSDVAWMEMKNNRIDVVIGPIETYEDRLFGLKAAHESYILVKDLEWSKRLARYATLLPALQEGLPVPDAYKAESPGTDSDLNAYDVIYYAGDCNAGSKTIAINLPNDETVQLEKGTRRLQLKNAMRAKFDRILEPLSQILIAEDQRDHITFDAFFGNIMFHEVAHGLGIKNTITGKGTVREALKDLSGTVEEGKADILGLYMIAQLIDSGELDADIEDYYVTFLAGIFRSVRFGASSAHGRANMMRFNFFAEAGAFTRDPDTGAYHTDVAKMRDAITALTRELLKLQGDGDYEATTAFVDRLGGLGTQLKLDLARLSEAGIPVDIVFEQGAEVLGLK